MRKILFVLAFVACASVELRAAEVSCVTNELSAIVYLQSKTFPTNDLQILNADFWPLRRDLLAILNKEFMPSSTNAFLAIAEFLSQGEFFPVSNRVDDIRLAHLHDNFLEFGSSNTVRRAGWIYYGPTARACIMKYNQRVHYNSELKALRISSLRDAKDALARPCWQAYSEEQRAEL